MAETQPTRSLGFFATLSTVTGTVIGSGIFFKVPAVTKATGTVSMATFTWLLAGIITILPQAFFRNCAILIGVVMLLCCVGLIVADLTRTRRRAPLSPTQAE